MALLTFYLTAILFCSYEKEEEPSEKFKNESFENLKEYGECDENNNVDNGQSAKLQFSKEAQLLSILLDRTNSKNEVDLKESLINKKDSKFWLNIDLELNDLDNLEKAIEAVQSEKQTDENKIKNEKQEKQDVNNNETQLVHQQLDNKKDYNLSKLNLLKIKKELIDDQTNLDQNKPKNLLELLDNEC